MNWDDIRLFLTIAQHRSFRRAAQQLDLGHATLARRIETLEEKLEVRLFNRQTTGLSLTEAGQAMLLATTPVKKTLEDLKVRLYAQDQSLSGKITLTLPGYLSTHLVLPALDEFQRAWPDVTIEIINDYRIMDLQNQEADIAIRATNAPDEQFIGRHVGGLYQAAYASKHYLAACKKQPDKPHNWFRPKAGLAFTMTLFDQFDNGLPVVSNLILFNIDEQLTCARLGKGIAVLPCLIGEADPALVRMSPIQHRLDLWLLCHKDLRNNKRMQLFRVFLVELFERNHALISGSVEQGDP